MFIVVAVVGVIVAWTTFGDAGLAWIATVMNCYKLRIILSFLCVPERERHCLLKHVLFHLIDGLITVLPVMLR